MNAQPSPPAGPQRPEYLVAEYQATQALFQHYDTFRWQAGSMLISGAFVFLGLLSNGDASKGAYALGSILVAVVLACWALFCHHHRQLYMFKIDRLIELELLMGAEQNRRFNAASLPEGSTTYPRFGPRGHDLDLAVFVAMGLGGPGLAALSGNGSPWLLVAVAVVVATAIWVKSMERRLLTWLREHRRWPDQNLPTSQDV